MTIRFRCQQISHFDADRQAYVRCGHEFAVGDDQAGDTIPCPECGNDVEVPVGVRDAITTQIPPGPVRTTKANRQPSAGHQKTPAVESVPLGGGGRAAPSLDQQLHTTDATPLNYASFHRQFACESCGAQIRPEMQRCPVCHRTISPIQVSAPLASMRVQPAGVQRFLMRMLSSSSSSKTTRILMDGFVAVPAVLISLGAFAAFGFFAIFIVPPLLGVVAGYFVTIRHLRRMMEEPGLPLLPWQRFVWNLSMPVFRSFGWSIPEAWKKPVLEWRNRDLRDTDFLSVPGINEVRVLDLTDSQLTDHELLQLHGLKQLRGISLIGTQVTDEGVFRLQQSILNAWIWY